MNNIETSCKDCVFARYVDNTQVGCDLNRLEKFRERGVSVDECFDNDKEFFVVRDRICMTCRHNDSPWVNKYPPEKWAEQVRKDVMLRLLVLVPILGNRTNIDDITMMVASLDKQEVEPAQVTIILNDDTKALPVVQALKPFKCNWVIKRVIERESDGSRVGLGRIVDMTVEEAKNHTFYSMFFPGISVPEKFTRELDHALNDELEKFSLLTPGGDGQGLVVQSALHSALGGNRLSIITEEEEPPAGYEKGQRLDSLMQKVEYYAAVNDTPHMVRKVSDVCPSLS